jgi:hypothetical protein
VFTSFQHFFNSPAEGSRAVVLSGLEMKILSWRHFFQQLVFGEIRKYLVGSLYHESPSMKSRVH